VLLTVQCVVFGVLNSLWSQLALPLAVQARSVLQSMKKLFVHLLVIKVVDILENRQSCHHKQIVKFRNSGWYK
jgi:hypothetical protein